MNDCKAMCMSYKSENDLGPDCVQICDGMTLSISTFTSYHGPLSNIYPECIVEQTVVEQVIQDNNATDCHICVSDISSIGGSWIIGDAVLQLGGDGPAGFPGGGEPPPPMECDTYHQVSVECVEQEFTQEVSSAICVEPGILIDIGDGELVECHDHPLQVYGDYWCPENYEYIDDGYCIETADVCDSGFTGAFECRCDTPYDPQNDTFWFMYQSNCFDQTPSLPSDSSLYDQACCYDSIVNGFEIWQWDSTVAGVKVY
jgi:hypothetical protein